MHEATPPWRANYWTAEGFSVGTVFLFVFMLLTKFERSFGDYGLVSVGIVAGIGVGRVLDATGWWNRAAFLLGGIAIVVAVCLVPLVVLDLGLGTTDRWPGLAVWSSIYGLGKALNYSPR